jgi:hypothetical protein
MKIEKGGQYYSQENESIFKRLHQIRGERERSQNGRYDHVHARGNYVALVLHCVWNLGLDSRSTLTDRRGVRMIDHL